LPRSVSDTDRRLTYISPPTGTPTCLCWPAICNWRQASSLLLGESLQLLRFAQLSEGDLVMTEAGKHFANLETDARKRLFAEHLLSYVPVMALIKRLLDERPSHAAPAKRFRNELEDYMSGEDADDTLKTIVSWGRYAELFAYDEQSETFSLENPR
jgi:NitT/TauT family transport system ATP-binding protein